MVGDKGAISDARVDSGSDDFQRLQSTTSAHVDVTMDSSLCRNCRRLMLEYEDLKKKTDIAMSFDRLKSSVQLGCYICSILYNAEWTVISTDSSDVFPVEKLNDISPAPDLFSCRIEQTEREGKTGCFHISATAASDSSMETIWLLELSLIPERHFRSVSLRPLSLANGLENTTRLARKWINDCQTMHSSCNHNMFLNSWIPTRLIYTGLLHEEPAPRLCLKSDIPSNVTYMTLSHCWGTQEIFTLTSKNILKMVESLPLEKLSKVFRDAIDLARNLGIGYIWIDSLCIIQDSIEDWTRESVTMGNVYKNSWCNIAATGFEDGLKGLFAQERAASIRDPKVLNLNVRFPNRPQGSSYHSGRYYCLENFWNSDIVNGRLNQRAWVYQERLLSPRVLHLGSHRVFWECRNLEACEVFPDGIPLQPELTYKSTMPLIVHESIYSDAENMQGNVGPSRTAGNTDRGMDSVVLSDKDRLDDNRKSSSESTDVTTLSSALILWWSLVSGYSRCHLTKRSDKLVAISGLAKEVQKLVKSRYVAGLWANNLPQQLVWFVPQGNEANRCRNPISPDYQAPSWSWAALNEPTKNILTLDEILNAKSLVSVLDYDVALATESEFGSVVGGHIRLQGSLTRATFERSDEMLREHSIDPDCHRVILKGRSSSVETVVRPWLLPDVAVAVPGSRDGDLIYPVRDAIGQRDFWLLPICATEEVWLGLILKHTGVKGQYQRLGAFLTLKEAEDFSLWLSHIPLLELEDYEERDDHGCTLSII